MRAMTDTELLNMKARVDLLEEGFVYAGTALTEMLSSPRNLDALEGAVVGMANTLRSLMAIGAR